MRILYFSKNYTLHDYNFLKKMAEELPHEIYFLQLEKGVLDVENQLLAKNINFVGYLCERVSPIEEISDIISLMPALESILSQVKPDLIHAGPVHSCGFLTALTDFHPFYLMSWGSDILLDAFKNDRLKWITKYTLNKSNYFICDCDAVRSSIKKIKDYDDAKIIQFPWGIDIEKFRPGNDTLKLRNLQGWENSSILLSTRMWEPVYGIDILLKAFYEAYSHNSQLRLVLLGDGTQALEVRKFIKKHNLKNVVYLPGVITHDKLVDYFNSVDLYISCSYSDGSSVSLLEAMGCGLPVIVTDIASNREWINNEENGLLVAEGDFSAFSNAILSLVTKDNEIKRIMSKNNRIVIEQKANWNLNIQKLFFKYNHIESDNHDR